MPRTAFKPYYSKSRTALAGYEGKSSSITHPIQAVFVIIMAIAISVSGRMTDTVIIADGTPGPYRLGSLFIDTSTIAVVRADSGYIPPFIYTSSVNGILFSDPVDSGVALNIRYYIGIQGIQKVFSLYEKRYGSLSDTLPNKSRDSLQREFVSPSRDNITVSGYKTVGVSVGSFGQVNLEQGLDVRIGGEVRPGTEISAHLNDQGTSLDGATREISEFDRIYITLTTPDYTVVAGDQYLYWPFSGILSGQKKIKGLSTTFQPGNLQAQVFGALAGGNFTVQTWRGEKGQGPYALHGNGETGFITPISQTVRVTVNGKVYDEDQAFVIDYDLGTITFTPRLLINAEDIIRAEYEYKTFDYQRMIAGGSTRLSTGDSTISIQGVIWSESDNKNNPIDLILSDDNLTTLARSGDRPPKDTNALLVNRNDVLDMYATVPLYSRIDSAGQVIFVHTKPDPVNPWNNDSLFEVHFTEDDSCGDYTRTTVDNEYVYVYAGPCKGTYVPLTPLSAPKRLISGELIARLKTSCITIETDIAGQVRDKNLFSSIDDNDNLASATHTFIQIGNRRSDKPSAWLSGEFRSFSAHFDQEALSAFERKSSWNDTAIAEKGIARYQWEAISGITPIVNLYTDVAYGQQWTASSITTDKLTSNTSYRPFPWLICSYAGTYFRHFEQTGYGTGHRQQTGISFITHQHRCSINGRDEWRNDTTHHGFGLLEGILNYEFSPLHLSEEMTITGFRYGNKGLFASPDTATALSWKQAINCEPLSGWRINGSGAWQQRKGIGTPDRKSSSTVLIDLNSETATSAHGFSSRQHYRTTAERASRYLQIPIRVSDGNGTHVWDSTLQEYVPDPQGAGNFIIQQREVLDSTNNLLTRKTGLYLTWSIDPPSKKASGILRDLTLEGSLQLDEHIDAEVMYPCSWFPGYLSLRNLWSDRSSWDKIRYADLFYRQELGWNPSSHPELETVLSVEPQFQGIRSYRENGLSIDFTATRSVEKNTTIGTVRFFSLFHEDTSTYSAAEDYYLRDSYLQFTRTHHMPHGIDFSLMSCFGWATQGPKGTISRANLFDSTLYVQSAPSISWMPRNAGRIELEYTFSFVTVPTGHDYRIARGFSSGISHTITFNGSIRAGKYFMLNGSYRGEIYGKNTGMNQPAEHIMSLEVQAFLE